MSSDDSDYDVEASDIYNDHGDYNANFDPDVSLDESILLNHVFAETTELQFCSFTQSHRGVFDEYYNIHDLKWYGFDKNAKFVYGVLCLNSYDANKVQIVKYSHVTSGFYFLKCFDRTSYRVLNFDEANGTFLFAKSGTVPTIVLYNVASDFETSYRFTDDDDFAFFLSSRGAFAYSIRHEWILVEGFGFRRVIFDEKEKSVSLSEHIAFPVDMFNVDHVFVYDKDTLIFLKNWNKILVYHFENGQFNVEDISIDGVVAAENIHPSYYRLRKLIAKGIRDLYVLSARYGVLKLDFPAKKWLSVKISVSVHPDVKNNLVTQHGFVQRFELDDVNCTLIGEPENGCFCALFTKISMLYPSGNKIVKIACCLSSQWSFNLQDLCVSKLFEEFRKNKSNEKMTDIECCRRLGISPALIEMYVGSAV